MTTRLIEGSEAIAEAMVQSGCRFFAGYPMTPFTEVLEHMARLLPENGGTCINAESEIEAIGMAWGAASTGTRAATGSTGQGLSLMQESLAEMALAGVPLVVLNMARGQGDYFQATRGGGHGDYRTPVLAPADAAEAVTLVAEAFELADRWRNPVLVVGDYYLAHTARAVDFDTNTTATATTTTATTTNRPTPEWALDGSTGGTGHAKLLSPLGSAKQREDVGYDMAEHYLRRANDTVAMTEGIEPRAETEHTDDADVIVVAYGTPARYVRAAVRTLRSQGLNIGFIRPITLYPFPAAIIGAAARTARAVVVYENNQGQMVDDVRLAVLGAAPVHFVGGLSLDSSGFGIAPDLEVTTLTERISQAIEHLDNNKLDNDKEA